MKPCISSAHFDYSGVGCTNEAASVACDYRMEDVRVLIAMEEDDRIYRAVIASGLHAMRPHLQVATAGPSEFAKRLQRFDPQIVICGGRAFARSEGSLVWIDLAFDTAIPLQRPALIWVGDRCREVPNPDLDYLLSVIDEVDPG